MSSGEVTSAYSTKSNHAVFRWARVKWSDRRGRGVSAERLSVLLLLFCCLAAALCGPAAAAEEEYTPVWDLGANDAVGSVAIARDGSTVVAGAGPVVYLLNREGDVLWKAAVGSKVNGVGISPEGSRIGVAADKLYLFDREGNLLWTEKTTYVYHSVALSSNGTYVAAGCDNGAVYLFDRNKKTLWDYDMGTDSYGIAISDNGRIVAVGCDDQGVYYLNSRQGESWSYGTGKCVKGIALTPDGRFVAAGSYDRCVYLSTGEGEHLWKYPTRDAVLSTALTNEAREVFAASGKTVFILDRTGAEIQKIAIDGRVESIAATPDGSLLVVGGGDGDRSIHLFTRDATLFESNNSGAVVNETAIPETVTVSPTPTNGSAGPAAEVSAQAEGEAGSITSQMFGWLENILSLLFKPQDDFLA